MKRTILIAILWSLVALAFGDEPILVNTKNSFVSTPPTIDFSHVTVLGLPLSTYSFVDSVVNNFGVVSLVNDSNAPGNLQYYGTDGAGNLGYHNLCSGLAFADSIVNTDGIVTLVGDTDTPGASQYYGTDGSSVLGFHSLSAGSGTVTSVDFAAPNGGFTVTGNPITTSGTITVTQHVADATHDGYLSQGDWGTFNGKQSALSFGDLTDAGTDGLTVTGGTGAVIGSGTSLAQHVSDSSHNGYLSSTDWNTFNTSATGSWVPTTRTLTINGTTQDLSANRTWTVGDALVANPLSQFAATTSAQLRSVLTDESGTGVFLTDNGSAANLTSFPTFNQNTTGSAATLTTSRNLWGQSFNGSANVGGAIELGTAGTTDATLDRNAPGLAQVEGNIIPHVAYSPTWTGTHTWQNVAGGHTFKWIGPSGTGQGLISLDNEISSPDVGSGSTIQFNCLDSTTAAQNQGEVRVEWTDATHATRKGRVRWRAYSGSSVGDEIDVYGGGGATLGTGLTTAPGAGILNVASGLQVNGTSALLNGGALGTPSSGTLTNCTFPTLNQDTTGSAVYWKTSGTGKAALSGPSTGTTRTYTGPDANATILTDNAAVTVAQGGTGQTSYTNGQLLIGNTTGNTLSKSTLTAGSNVTITNGTGTITIASSAGLASHTLWGQAFDGTGDVSGSLTSVGNITGGASSMTITAGTGNSRTLSLQSTTSGGTATTFLTGNADQSVTLASGFTASGASSIGTSNAFTAGTIELGNASDTTLSRSSGGVLAVEGVKVLATNSTSGTQQGLVAVNSSSGAVVGTQNRSTGTSTSGTPGTAIASITAAAGNQLVSIHGVCSQTSSTTTQILITVTYSDSTTTTMTSSTPSNTIIVINDAGMISLTTVQMVAHSAKKITSVAATTAGAGTGTRVAALSAIEIPQ
jgi:hypothetical protein